MLTLNCCWATTFFHNAEKNANFEPMLMEINILADGITGWPDYKFEKI